MNRIIPFRWLRILIGLFVILAVIWTAVWFFAASWIGERMDDITMSLKDRGTTVECAKRRVSGFPFSLSVNCEKTSVVTVRGTERADAGALTTGASVFSPDVITTNLKSPFTSFAGGKELRVDWTRLEAKVDANLNAGLDLIELRGNKIKLSRDGLEASTRSHLSRFTPELWNRKSETKTTSLRYRFSVKYFELKNAVGLEIPPSDIRGVAVLKDGYLDLVDRRLPINSVLADGANIRLVNLVITLKGGGQLGFSGPIQLSKDGLVSGKVRMGIAEPKAVAEWAAKIDPNLQQAVVGLAQATSGMGKPSKIGGKDMRTISVKIKRGEIRLGFIKLGKIPRLQFDR